MKRSIFIFLLVLVSIYNTNAQNLNKKWGAGIDYGTVEYRGELGNQFFDFSQWKSAYGLHVNRFLNPSFDVGFSAAYNSIAVTGPGNQNYSMNGELYTFMANIQYKFNDGSMLKVNSLFKPYVKQGAGMVFGKTWGLSMDNFGSPYQVNLNDFVLSLKGGTKYSINERLDAFVELGNLWVTTIGIDGSKIDASNDQFLQLNLGITFSFGLSKDTDKDGVIDKIDSCPATPLHVEVDEWGCPFDSDGDSLYDYLDECPDEFGSIFTQGCPDRDNDGVADKVDECPDEPGLKSNNGCPEIDMEKQLDSLIQLYKNKDVRVFYVIQDEGTAPVVYSSPNNEGMAYDADGDGVSDNVDLCPFEAGSIENYGCPVSPKSDTINQSVLHLPFSDIAVQHGCPEDTDCDGISNELDACPENPGSIKLKGCPIEKLKPKWRHDLEMKPVHFMSGSNYITEFSQARVDKVIAKLKAYSELNVWMFGHTDPSGPSDLNVKLSEKRIEAIVKYMVSKGILKERIYTIGLGESFPVSIVFSEEGQLLNRRVDFYLFEFE